MDLTDEALVHAFESATLPPSRFDHAAHVRVGWCYLRRYPLGEALDRFRRALRAFADAHGATGKYHETITVTYMLAIAERVADAPGLEWTEFAARYPELFERNPSMVERYYSKDVLASDRARGSFVMPIARGEVAV